MCKFWSILIITVFFGQSNCYAQDLAGFQNRKILFDSNWQFILGDPANAADVDFNDQSWKKLDLPHDWSIESPIEKSNSTGGAGGFAPAGIGWYRKSFTPAKQWMGKKLIVEFEGVYMNAEIWLNGSKIESHPYGYTSFTFDLTSQIKFGSINVLAVRVDNSQQPNSRWYSGSGIYRHVWLMAVNPVHISPWGVFVSTTQANSSLSKVQIQTEIECDIVSKESVVVKTEIIGPDEKILGSISTNVILAQKKTTSSQEITITKPPLWSPEQPQLCKVITQILVDRKVVDQVETQFGIRTISWSTEKGIQINGKTIKLCGGCIHHENGFLGAAAYDRAEERKIEILKSAGFNAIRTAHNPPSPALLSACDRLGMLVMEEAFDCWEKKKSTYDYAAVFNNWWQKDIDAMVMRDRNHPSVIFWSIGNEIPDQSTERVAELTKLLSDRVKSLDNSRPVTEGIDNLTSLPEKENIHNRSLGALDIVGYNYGRDKLEKDHERIPSRIMVITESVQGETFDCWKAVNEKSYVLGDFVWTAMDYLGENGIGRWQFDSIPYGHGDDKLFPWHGAYCGDVDITGFRKPISHYRNIVWERGEKLFISVQQPTLNKRKIFPQRWGVFPSQSSWSWPGFENELVKVEVYSRCDSVVLYQDDKWIGGKPTTEREKFKAQFEVIYKPGNLKAVGYLDGKPIEKQELKTAGAAASIRLTADRINLQANGMDLSFISVEIVDKNGLNQPSDDREITFFIEGPGVIQGLGSADMTSLEPYSGNTCKTFQGRALVVVKTQKNAGSISLKASSHGLKTEIINLKSNSVLSGNKQF